MDAYRSAGVDREAAAKAVALITNLARDATRAEVVQAVGGFEIGRASCRERVYVLV